MTEDTRGFGLPEKFSGPGGTDKRILIISNRLPITVSSRNGRLNYHSSTGGLVTGLGSFYKRHKSIWIGWPGIASEVVQGQEEKIKKRLSSENCYPVFLNKADIDDFYYGFCNKTLWPLFHYFPLYAVYDECLWKTYIKVNEVFGDIVTQIANRDDIIWVHDYHLMLLPNIVRKKMPDATIGYFLHIPFPSFEIFRLLPWRKEILTGLLGADLVGFHTYDYVRHFVESVRRLLGYEHSFGNINAGTRVVKTDAFPMGIDYGRFSNAFKDPKVQKEVKKIRKKVGERKIILSIDRLDYSKGIPERLEAYDIYLERNLDSRQKVTLILLAVPSRTEVDQYMQLKKRVDEMVGRINGKYGTIDWMPIWYMYRSLPFHDIVALYNAADVALVTPLRDGMNLIAKEFVASGREGRGVLILSEMAGAAKELGEAIIVNPNNREEIVVALEEALRMPEDEQVSRNRLMQQRLKRYDISRWASDFMEGLLTIKKTQQDLSVRRLTYRAGKDLVDNYHKSERALILLDYDGTLTPLVERPEKAKPDADLLKLLEMLCDEPKNEVVIVSGRDKDVLEQWFGALNLGLIAEHGVWIKKKDGEWQLTEHLRSDWKDQVRPLMELYVDRTPGSFLEEKDFSLAWHYRRADPELAEVRSRELKDALLHLTVNLNLGVLEGSKVIEVKEVSVNKGRGVMRWLSEDEWDFILAVGDDRTDEDVFAVLPESAYSIKVGIVPSKARFNIVSQYRVRELLRELISKKESRV